MGVGNPRAPSASAEYTVPIGHRSTHGTRSTGRRMAPAAEPSWTHNFPADGKYVFSVNASLGGGHTSEDMDISIDGERVALLALPHGRALGRRAAGRGGNAIPLETEPFFVEAGQRPGCGRLRPPQRRFLSGPTPSARLVVRWEARGPHPGPTTASRICLTSRRLR